MEHIAALLLVVGCSSDFSDCRELPAPVPIFETYEECQALLPTSLQQLQAAGQHVAGTCVFVDPAAEEEDAELVWNVASDGSLKAEIVTSAVLAQDGSENGESDAF